MSTNTEHAEAAVTLAEGRTTQSPESIQTAAHTSTRSFIRRLWDNDVVKFGLPAAIFLLVLFGAWGLFSYLDGGGKSICAPRSFCG